MSQADHEYLSLLRTVRSASHRSDRTGVGTLSLFGQRMEFDLDGVFPLLTTKKVHWVGTVEELRWFLRGKTNTNDLDETARHWWTPWQREGGDLGPIYGQQYRRFGGHKDQLAELLFNLKHNPYSRRHVVSLWDPNSVHEAALPCCHGTAIQFYVDGKDLHCQMYQRSGDLFLGVPVNIASYALLTYLIAHELDLRPKRFVHVLGDTHIYQNHLAQVDEQLSREARPAPSLLIAKDMPPLLEAIERPEFKDYLLLTNYNPHPAIKAPLAV